MGFSFKEIGFIKKLRTIKHIEIIVLVIAAIIVGLIFYSTLTPDRNSSNSNSSQQQNTGQPVVGYLQYGQDLENRLSKVLGEINGAGRVSVIVTLEGPGKVDIAYSTEERNGVITKTPIIITQGGQSRPLILAEHPPEIRGVVIVASGASDIRVRLDIIRATEAALKIPSSKIEVVVGR